MENLYKALEEEKDARQTEKRLLRHALINIKEEAEYALEHPASVVSGLKHIIAMASVLMEKHDPNAT